MRIDHWLKCPPLAVRRPQDAARTNVPVPRLEQASRRQSTNHGRIAMLIKDSTVLVTGANRGIGLELVKASLHAGARKVYAGARDLRTLAAVEALDRARVKPLRLDV